MADEPVQEAAAAPPSLFGPQNTIGTADRADSVFAVDVDGDGDVDVLSASYRDNRVAWYENDGSENFVTHTISSNALGAKGVLAADLNGDGDVDVIHSSYDINNTNKITWYENDGNGGFTNHTITATSGMVVEVIAEDLDGDGDVDLVTASFPPSASDSRIAWYENDGNGSFTPHTVITGGVAHRVFATDVDGDGDVDLLSVSAIDDRVDWYENDGSENFTAHSIGTNLVAPFSVVAADLDGDGDVDVLSASVGDNKIVWYENDGSQHFTARTVSTSAVGIFSLSAVDVDGDGDVDVVSGGGFGGQIMWHENDGSENFTTHTLNDSGGSVFVADRGR